MVIYLEERASSKGEIEYISEREDYYLREVFGVENEVGGKIRI